MIENSERKQLYEIGRTLKPNSTVVEFGTFLGGSMACLLEGYAKNENIQDKKKGPLFVTYDGFKCPIDSDLRQYVEIYAKKANLAEKIKNEDSTINWKKAAISVIESVKCLNPAKVLILEKYIDQSYRLPEIVKKIDFLHLDMPKDWESLKPILVASVDVLEKGSIIAFQDYGFELSGELIYIFNKLCYEKKLIPLFARASTVYFKVNSQISITEIEWLEDKLRDLSNEFARDVYKFLAFAERIPGIRNSEKQAILVSAVQLISQSKLQENIKLQVVSKLLIKARSLDPSDLYLYTRLARVMASSMSTNKPLK